MTESERIHKKLLVRLNQRKQEMLVETVSDSSTIACQVVPDSSVPVATMCSVRSVGGTRRKSRAILTKHQAIEIFKLRRGASAPGENRRSSATEVARCYKVSEKAIRDIWKGRTWARQTSHGKMLPSQPDVRAAGETIPNRSESSELKLETLDNSDYAQLSIRDICDVSVDAHLYAWAEGEVCLIESTDPFRIDWITASTNLRLKSD